MVKDDPYEHAAKGKLRLKCDSNIKKRKKSKRRKSELANAVEQEQTDSKSILTRTQAEIAFKNMQEKMVCMHTY